MLIDIITFEIADFTTKTVEEFTVRNTPENIELILTNRFTRNIVADKMLDFQFEKEEKVPFYFIAMDTWVQLINVQPELFDAFLIEA